MQLVSLGKRGLIFRHSMQIVSLGKLYFVFDANCLVKIEFEFIANCRRYASNFKLCLIKKHIKSFPLPFSHIAKRVLSVKDYKSDDLFKLFRVLAEYSVSVISSSSSC